MIRARRLLALAGLLAVLAPPRGFAADSAAPAALVPEYEVTVSDGARIRTLFRENTWMKDFLASNLFRGSMVRLGPVLYAAGTGDSWKGRLLDFLAERFLAGRPVRVSYFRAPGLVSPFGITLPALTAREREAANLVIRALRSGGDVAEGVSLGDGGGEVVSVTPIALRLQRFAVAEAPTCVAISRDPRVAAVLSRRCAVEPRPAAAVIDVDTRSFFSAWSAVLERLFGVGGRLRLTFDWDSRRARFTPAGAELALADGHLLGTGPADPALLAAVPADTLLFAMVFLPDPGPLSIATVQDYFRTARGSKDVRAVPMALVYLGMRAGKEDRPEALSVLLVPQEKTGDRALADLDALFNQNASYEVHASRACPGFVALSPSRAALERIADACAGRQPSFLQVSPRLLAGFTRQPLSAGLFWNAGGFLKSAVAWGWERDRPQGDVEEPGARRGEAPPAPPELAQAMRLLDRLPMYAFTGRVRGGAVVMTGAEP